ncbi:hypothetical protein NQZ68_042121, partial [Dissostichus eleginoides]
QQLSLPLTQVVWVTGSPSSITAEPHAAPNDAVTLTLGPPLRSSSNQAAAGRSPSVLQSERPVVFLHEVATQRLAVCTQRKRRCFTASLLKRSGLKKTE